MHVWINDYSVGIPKIDNQHKHMFLLVEKIYDIIIENSDGVNLILMELIKYTNDHFKEEIEYLLSKNIEKSDIIDHMREHQILISKIINILHDYIINDRKNISIDVATLTNEWIENHIIDYDVPYFKSIKK